MPKFNLRIETEESGKPVRKWTPAEDQGSHEPVECCVYGDYVVADAEHIEEAKAVLLESMFHTIRTIAEKDNFWILRDQGDGKFAVGWKAEFPQMMEGNR